MLGLFRKRRDDAAGLDTGAAGHKVCRLKGSLEAPEVEQWLESAELKSVRCGGLNIAVNGPSVVVRAIPMGHCSELERYLPYAASEAEIRVTDVSPEEVLLTAVPTDLARQARQRVEAAGLRAQSVEPEALALQRALPYCCRLELTAAVLQLGATGSHLYIFQQGVLRHSHSLSPQPAGALVKDLTAAFHYFRSRHQVPVEQLVLSGGPAASEELQRQMEAVGVPCLVAGFRGLGPAATVAAGLALSSLAG